jgi:hypothetical protein
MDQSNPKDDPCQSPGPPLARIRPGVSWGLGIDWEAEPGLFYQTASRMLGITTCPVRHIQDEDHEQAGERPSTGGTHRPVSPGICLGPPDGETPDP